MKKDTKGIKKDMMNSISVKEKQMCEMYDIQVTSNENQSSAKPFQTSIRITAGNEAMEEQLSLILLEDDYFLNTYRNPVLWLFNFSPMYVYIRKFQSELESSNQLIKMNEAMVFQFERKSHCKYFESVVQGVLAKFINKKLSDLHKEILFFPAKELLSE
nr:hypothetical protein [uncultured Bacillus sp.]